MTAVRRRARDWPQASRDVAQAYFPHELRPLAGSHPPRLILHTLQLGPVLIGQVGWGADVSIDCDYPGAVEVNMPLTGHLESRGRFGSVTSVPGQGTVFRADTPSLITHWDATCTVIGVKFDAAWLEVEAERVLGTDRTRVGTLLPERLCFDQGLAKAWHQLIFGLAAHLGSDSRHVVPATDSLFFQQLAGAVSTGFLTSFLPEQANVGIAGPRMVRLVIDAMHDDPSRAWTAGEMAATAGTSARRLQESFRQWVGCTPTQYLSDVRLQRARAELRADPGVTIGEVSARWGFSSPSRFAVAYGRRYGTAPSRDRAG
jgi:AraC-like DNA-binding protein